MVTVVFGAGQLVSPATGSPTATLLRLHPSYPSRRAGTTPTELLPGGVSLYGGVHPRYSENNSHGVTGGVY